MMVFNRLRVVVEFRKDNLARMTILKGKALKSSFNFHIGPAIVIINGISIDTRLNLSLLFYTHVFERFFQSLLLDEQKLTAEFIKATKSTVPYKVKPKQREINK